MSWWWKPKTASGSEQDNEILPPTQTNMTVTETSTPPVTAIPPASNIPQRILTREEQAEQEWSSLLKELQAEANTVPDVQTTSQRKEAASATTPIQTDISPHTLYPTEMSCRSSFDYAMFCQSFGGQFVNVYRYGDFRSCSNHWDDFWLCMRTRQWKKEDRQRAIQEHYRKKAIKWKTGPSSEDVWEVRIEPVQNPISGNLVELEAELARLEKDSQAA